MKVRCRLIEHCHQRRHEFFRVAMNWPRPAVGSSTVPIKQAKGRVARLLHFGDDHTTDTENPIGMRRCHRLRIAAVSVKTAIPLNNNRHSSPVRSMVGLVQHRSVYWQNSRPRLGQAPPPPNQPIPDCQKCRRNNHELATPDVKFVKHRFHRWSPEEPTRQPPVSECVPTGDVTPIPTEHSSQSGMAEG